MKSWRFILMTLCVFSFSSCRKEEFSHSWLETAEELLQSNPDSAFVILDEVAMPDNLEDEEFVRWCMLSGKVHDKLHNTILPVYQFERAYSWCKKEGTPEEQAQMALYLGRSHVADGEYDKAMLIYIDALQIANDNQLDNVAGYISSYMGDLYERKDMQKEALKKYEIAAQLFKKAGNMKSYAYALRDIGREYAFLDSLSCALKFANKADSVAVKVGDSAVRSSTINALGNVLLLQQQYEKAERLFQEALSMAEIKHKISNYFALIKLYLRTDNLSEALRFLKETPNNTLEYNYFINKSYYQIYKKGNNFLDALCHLETCQILSDSISLIRDKSKVLETERRYNFLKMQNENHRLQIAQQRYIIIITLYLLMFLLIILAYFYYRKRMKDKIYCQKLELNNGKIELLKLSVELEKKKTQLAIAERKNEGVIQLQEEITSLSSRYRKLQQTKIATSVIARKLISLSNQNIPQNNKALLTSKHWKSIISEITLTYPSLRVYLLEQCPDLLDMEWQYCCLYMFQLDGNAEAKLLGISPNSVRTKRYRLRQRLKISLSQESTLYECLINDMEK